MIMIEIMHDNDHDDIDTYYRHDDDDVYAWVRWW